MYNTSLSISIFKIVFRSLYGYLPTQYQSSFKTDSYNLPSKVTIDYFI